MDDLVLYEHSQSWPRGFVIVIYLILIAALSPQLFFGIREDWWVGLIVIFATTLVVVVFARLTVTVTYQEIRLAFTLGWPSKRIERSMIRSVVHHRVAWWYGLGIRRTTKGWMWKIWGGDTVMIELSDRKFLIGTDDPDGLQAALDLSE